MPRLKRAIRQATSMGVLAVLSWVMKRRAAVQRTGPTKVKGLVPMRSESAPLKGEKTSSITGRAIIVSPTVLGER